MNIFVYFFCASSIIGIAVHGNKTIEGYSAGLLPECPGSTKPAVISKQHLKYLEIYVTGIKSPRKRNKYTYDTARDIAKDPMMDWNKRTVLFVPGYLDTIRTLFGRMVRGVYRDIGYNVWLLDFYKLMRYEYPVAARALKPIGHLIADVIVKILAAQPKFDLKKFDVLGLSFGGQAISFIAKRFKNITGTKLPRLTALDPAGPCFRNRGPEDRLDKSDADFVDVVYTNIGNAAMAAPAGHVTVYVNGGEFQPGDIYWNWCNSICSHGRSFTLWLSTLLYPDSFIAIKCNSVQDARDSNCYNRKPMVTNLVGLNVDKNKTGIFYLATRNRFPFYMGKDGLKKQKNFITNKTVTLNAKDILIL